MGGARLLTCLPSGLASALLALIVSVDDEQPLDRG